LILLLKKRIFTTFLPVIDGAMLISHQLIINSMQSMYTNGNIKITEARSSFGDDKNGIE